MKCPLDHFNLPSTERDLPFQVPKTGQNLRLGQPLQSGQLRRWNQAGFLDQCLPEGTVREVLRELSPNPPSPRLIDRMFRPATLKLRFSSHPLQPGAHQDKVFECQAPHRFKA